MQKKHIRTIADDTEITGYVVGESKGAITIRLVAPKQYSCTATCHVGEQEGEQTESLLKALYLMLTCIEAILRNDKQTRTHLKIKLHHANSRVSKLDYCISTVSRLLDNTATTTNDIKILFAVIIGEYRYWHSQQARIFNDYFKESIGRWEFCDVPPIVDDILRKGSKNNLSD